eukprot:symbB.v1.2.035581.t1/scaffold4825.1/size34278/1
MTVARRLPTPKGSIRRCSKSRSLAKQISIWIQDAKTCQRVLHIWRKHHASFDAIHAVSCFWRMSILLRNFQPISAKDYTQLAQVVNDHVQRDALEARRLCNILVGLVYSRNAAFRPTPWICFDLATNCAEKLEKKIPSAATKDISSAAWASAQLLSMWQCNGARDVRVVHEALSRLLMNLVPVATSSILREVASPEVLANLAWAIASFLEKNQYKRKKNNNKIN